MQACMKAEGSPHMCSNLEDFAKRINFQAYPTRVQAGLLISGINAEVMPGQWEFQIGPVGAPAVGDEVMVARWLLHRLGEQFGIVCTFHPKPVKGDWNGNGTVSAHTCSHIFTFNSEGGQRWSWSHAGCCTAWASSSALCAPLTSSLSRAGTVRPGTICLSSVILPWLLVSKKDILLLP